MNCSEATDEISERLIDSYAMGDTEGIIRSLNDLESVGWENLHLESAFIGLNGERLIIKFFIKGYLQVIAPGTSKAFRLIWTLRFRSMILNDHRKYIKHKNEMSPEEYEWVGSIGD